MSSYLFFEALFFRVGSDPGINEIPRPFFVAEKRLKRKVMFFVMFSWLFVTKTVFLSLYARTRYGKVTYRFGDKKASKFFKAFFQVWIYKCTFTVLLTIDSKNYILHFLLGENWRGRGRIVGRMCNVAWVVRVNHSLLQPMKIYRVWIVILILSYYIVSLIYFWTHHLCSCIQFV